MRPMGKSRILWLSVGAAVLTIALKFSAYILTGSVGLLSDAAESLVNLAAAIFALIALQIASQPPDDEHRFGHDKAEYFSSGAEGILILVAAAVIVYSAVERLLYPEAISQLGWGLGIAVVASGVNIWVARILLRAAQRYDSITLEADAHHLMTDVWTSVGVVSGLTVVSITGWQLLDPIIAIVVAFNIIRTGLQLVLRSVRGLMDFALPTGEVALIEDVLARYRSEYVTYHALRTRKAGPRRFVDLHLLVEGRVTVDEAHELCNRIEKDIKAGLDQVVVIIHVEPAADKTAWIDDFVPETAVTSEP
jgi:cation diffusion facilitator family transporter